MEESGRWRTRSIGRAGFLSMIRGIKHRRRRRFREVPEVHQDREGIFGVGDARGRNPCGMRALRRDNSLRSLPRAHSLPALSTDTLATTAPETVKPSASTQQATDTPAASTSEARLARETP